MNYSLKSLKSLTLIFSIFILESIFLGIDVQAQSEKPIVINQEQNIQSEYPEVPGYDDTFTKSISSCWGDLDGNYTNITNSVYGLSGWAEAHPGDDGSYGPIDLGFTYTFYGEDFTSVYINVNGNVTFGNVYASIIQHRPQSCVS